MKYLLETQVLLWFVNGDSSLPKKFPKKFITNENQIFVSYVSIWEIGIKNSIGKLHLSENLQYFIDTEIKNYKFQLLDILLPHIVQATSLPLHHRDPFDRMLIAQSIIENIPVISSDSIFDRYSINRIW